MSDAEQEAHPADISPPVGHIHRILDAAGLLCGGQFPGPVPRPPVGGTHVCQLAGVPRAAVMLRDYLGDDVNDPGERESARQERVDADLVGGVVGGRGGAAGRPRLAGDADGGERLLVQRLEGPGVGGGPVDRRGGAGDPVRPAQRERDRDPHVGRAGLRDRRPVGELDHRVDHRLPVHHHLDRVEADPEQQVGLDHLQALVDQRRGVDRDDRPHVPGGVGQRLLRASPAASSARLRCGTGRRSRSAPAWPPHRRTRRAGTARSRSARSRPGRSGPARPGPPPAGRRRSATPCSPAPAPARRAARPGWRPGR